MIDRERCQPRTQLLWIALARDRARDPLDHGEIHGANADVGGAGHREIRSCDDARSARPHQPGPGVVLACPLYMIPTTLIFHAFWNFHGAERLPQIVNFMKNLAIMGGLSTLVAFGGSRFSIDHRIRRARAR
jgi:hypothetical protein